jgi:BMFP domain-containing protein YqiC
MKKTHALDDMLKQLCDAIPPGFQHIKEDLEKNFRSVLENTFHKFNLVTREEFDAQAGVLSKTREKLEKIEKQMSELEKKLMPKKSSEKK